GEEPALASPRLGPHRPLRRIEGVELRIGHARKAAEIEIAPPLVLETGERRVLAEHVGRGAICECGAVTHAARDFGDDPPVARRPPRAAPARRFPAGAAARVWSRPLPPRPGRRGPPPRPPPPRPCRWSACSRRRRTGRACGARRAPRLRAATTPPGWSPSPTP